MQKRTTAGSLLGALVCVFVSGNALAGDAAKGKLAFSKCVMCHSVVRGDNRSMLGPNLYNVVGRPAGSLSEYRYSMALQDNKTILDESALDRWIENPQGFAPRNHETGAGIKDAQMRQDIIAYLKTLR